MHFCSCRRLEWVRLHLLKTCSFGFVYYGFAETDANCNSTAKRCGSPRDFGFELCHRLLPSNLAVVCGLKCGKIDRSHQLIYRIRLFMTTAKAEIPNQATNQEGHRRAISSM